MDLPDFIERKFISILLKFLRTSKKTKFFSLNLIEEKNITEIKFLLTLQLESFTEEKFFLAIMREICFQLYVAKISFSSVERDSLFNLPLDNFFNFTDRSFHSI